MSSMTLHRYVLMVLFCTFVLILEGALATSKAAGLFQTGHRRLAFAIGGGLLFLAVWSLSTASPGALKTLACTPFLAFVAQLPLLAMRPAWLTVAHALAAQLVLCNLLAIIVVGSWSWPEQPAQVEDSASPSLQSVTAAVPLVMFVQIALGAAFRHNALGGIPHIVGAIVSMGVALLACIFILSQHAAHSVLRNSAFALLSLTLVQVFLGLGAYLAKASDPFSMNTAVLTVSHLAVGTLTLAASLNLALQVSKHVRRIIIVRVPSPSAAAVL